MDSHSSHTHTHKFSRSFPSVVEKNKCMPFDCNNKHNSQKECEIMHNNNNNNKLWNKKNADANEENKNILKARIGYPINAWVVVYKSKYIIKDRCFYPVVWPHGFSSTIRFLYCCLFIYLFERREIKRRWPEPAKETGLCSATSFFSRSNLGVVVQMKRNGLLLCDMKFIVIAMLHARTRLGWLWSVSGPKPNAGWRGTVGLVRMGLLASKGSRNMASQITM